MSEFKTNVTSDAFWLKTLYIIGFYLVFRLIDILLLFVAVAQWAFTLFAGKPNVQLASFGASLSIYVQQIVQYLAGSSEEKPFPFQDWPVVSRPETETAE